MNQNINIKSTMNDIITVLQKPENSKIIMKGFTMGAVASIGIITTVGFISTGLKALVESGIPEYRILQLVGVVCLLAAFSSVRITLRTIQKMITNKEKI